MDFRKNFSERLHDLRINKNVSLTRLGEHLGVTDEAVRLLEKAKRAPLQLILMFPSTTLLGVLIIPM